MTYHDLIAAIRYVILIAGLLTLTGCGDGGTHEKGSPAEVSKPDEHNLSTITLTEKAYERLKIEKGLEEGQWKTGLALVQEKTLPRMRTFGGEVMVPPGATIRVSAPLAGTVAAPKAGVPVPGSKLQKGQAIFEFSALLPPEAKVNLTTAALEAERQVDSAKIQQKTAQLALDRAQQLASEKSVSQRVVDEAIAARDLAQHAVKTAEARSKLLSELLSEAARGGSTSRTLTAPVPGVLQRVDAAPGETVAAGAALFEVIQIDRVWVRVPLYVGWLHEVDAPKEAEIRLLGASPKAKPALAKPLPNAPPAADPQAASADLYYQLDNSQGLLLPGQKVHVALSMKGPQKNLVVPWAAVVFDIHGGSWVYQQLDEPKYTFRRQRVEVRYVLGDDAILASGPPEGAKVATGGAAELLGTEFGLAAAAHEED